MTHKKSPWIALAIGTLGLVAGYSVVVFSHDTAFASGKSCPLKEMREKCANGGCDARACANGECGADCPGCHHG